MSVFKQIPNLITSLNAASGCVAIVMAFNQRYESALLFILLAAVLDFFDGFAARLLKAYSLFGKELDSLADVISFGLAPGMVVYALLNEISPSNEYVAYTAFLIPVFSALRLAKFNIDERQTSSFIGLPTPPNAIFWGSSVALYSSFFVEHPVSTWIIVASVVLFSLLLVSPIPMFSLKIKSLSFKENKVQCLFLFGILVLLGIFKLKSIPFIIVFYIVLSAMWFLLRKNKQK